MNNLIDMNDWLKKKCCLPTLIAPDITAHYSVFYGNWILLTKNGKYSFESLVKAKSFGNRLYKTQKLKR